MIGVDDLFARDLRLLFEGFVVLETIGVMGLHQALVQERELLQVGAYGRSEQASAVEYLLHCEGGDHRRRAPAVRGREDRCFRQAHAAMGQ
jgi:hypothetical protein